MDAVIVATALPAIAPDLNARSNEAYRMVSGFLFAQAVSQPLYSTFSSVLGKKQCLFFAIAVLTVASCCTAECVVWLIRARVVRTSFCFLSLTF
jgi:MFS family permease